MARTPVGNQTRPVTGSQTETSQPPLFKVLMHNDDYTTMEFVVEVLQSVFHKGPTEADSIMLHVHFNGVGVCGVYPFEVAEMKVARVHALARTRGYPLRCSVDRI